MSGNKASLRKAALRELLLVRERDAAAFAAIVEVARALVRASDAADR